MWLGHHPPAFTLATYVHLLPDDLPDASFLDAVTAAEEGNAGATRHPETDRNEARTEGAETRFPSDMPRAAEASAAYG
jgi:hypothetical protein